VFFVAVVFTVAQAPRKAQETTTRARLISRGIPNKYRKALLEQKFLTSKAARRSNSIPPAMDFSAIA
jgi:hypothetical protein